MRPLALLAAAALLAGCRATTQVELELGAFSSAEAGVRVHADADGIQNPLLVYDPSRLIDPREERAVGLALVDRPDRPPLVVGAAPFTLLRPPIAVTFESDDPDEPDVRITLTEPRVGLGPIEGTRCPAGAPVSRTLRVDLPMRVARATVRVDVPGYALLEETLHGEAARTGVYVAVLCSPQ